ncbi:LOW QUALITY PROTEIN: hypothetical protein PFAG_05665 [Plasmodium falciparum Santa Lucia]|uniref:Uncharacterized protein n=6 Tax=Plasmodium falciparum TaxID=5833 RepID=W4IW31_PLAFP|nr:LOW QUALITY PROTEIN: hypothetical protein PFFVO_05198 [Plasmodium falciparum Vietnam Oak-Knoll (FVO)]ETW33685.1 LOW QUALITY PROTEIN: hypothetical protein PFTANZ_05548 [Plasmodium falciparum Tanzania (2000708)]ETW39684.1 LOW QUALITY PROTEIN: hypothetical protein PFNF135_05713 [Plasmodium falciparum NF135/5.C10]ETW54233.1 LOW QUALITY PROTEIN: hypothetical protein PFUGPA_04103 [Plasmodium falciparum Palo Alto/Uganda]EUR62420.1 LOW QUALITY PROTEIN: hypothetical protein PFBG_05631 [Plasmodium fal
MKLFFFNVFQKIITIKIIKIKKNNKQINIIFYTFTQYCLCYILNLYNSSINRKEKNILTHI